MSNVSPENYLVLIKKHQHRAPVDLLAIANEFNLKIFKGLSSNPSISGKITKDTSAKESYSIYINSAHAHVRQRFTIAHEIAHYILHRDKIGDGLVDDALYRSGLNSADETEANKLAAQILMPWELINQHIQATSTIQSLAKIFDVSESAMAIRLGIPC